MALLSIKFIVKVSPAALPDAHRSIWVSANTLSESDTALAHPQSTYDFKLHKKPCRFSAAASVHTVLKRHVI